MQFTRLNALAACGILVLAACAQPEPEPVTPEPIFDKYGNAVSECRPADQPVSTAYPAYLPICAPECPPGQQPGTTAAGQPLVCVPIRREDNGDQPTGGRQPTGGQSPTGAAAAP
jgi:hypothetical protein